jgi:hypothetical protein
MRGHLKAEHLNSDTVVVTPVAQSYRLARNVSAIPILFTPSEGCSPLGLITQLPEGAQIDIGGPGFNDHTVKVRCGGASYYVFLEDLEPQRKRAASAS